MLDTNKINLRLKPANDTGWCNENIFYNGRFFFASAEGTAVSGTRNIQLIEASATAVNGPPNNNLFIKPSIEGDTPEFHLDIQGTYNTILNGRFESFPPKVRYYSRTTGQTSRNDIIGGFTPQSIVYTFDGLASPHNGLVNPYFTAMHGSASTLQISCQNSSGKTGRHITGFEAGQYPVAKATNATDYAYLMFAQGLAGKRGSDTEDRVLLDFVNGRIYFGSGAAAATAYLGYSTGDIAASVDLVPTTDDTNTLGASSLRWSNAYARQFRPGSGTPIWSSGTGTSEGVVTAAVGSLFTRTDGAAATTLYVKETGSGNTGWAAK